MIESGHEKKRLELGDLRLGQQCLFDDRYGGIFSDIL